MRLTPGSRLGPYEILAPLGAGGMGEIYRARDPRLGREVAVKVLPAAMADDPGRLARFEREARAVAGLNHPNIVTLHSVEDDGAVRFLTMELVEGRSLDHEVVPGGLPVPQVIGLGIALADALAAAHEKGVVHRDLKPANVMLTRDGRVKVLDFGLAKLAAPDPGVDLTQAATLASPVSGTGQVVGTAPYMAPEQIRGEVVDARTDLFALGVVLYELASGKRPFAGETHVDVSHAILRDAPKPLLSIRADLPADLDRIVGRCLEKNPRERAQSALDVSNELRRLRRELERSEAGLLAKPAAGTDKVASIAVLPFVNRSASPDDEYFSDGLADELLNVLSKIKGLRVTARTSSFHFKNKDATIAEIGKALGVASILEGSVRKAGSRIRVAVQLVNVTDSSHLWAETYDRTLEDIFAVQDDIAHSVVKELRTTLMGEAADSDASGQARAEVAEAARGRGTDPEAHRLCLLARHFRNQLTRQDTARAIGYLQEALARDSTYALAWVELGLAQMNEAGFGWAPSAEGHERAREALARALALDADLPEALAAMGRLLAIWARDFRGAEAYLARAVELAPGNAEVLHRAGNAAVDRGRFDQGIRLIQQSLEQDPLSPHAYGALGYALYCADRLAEAEVAYRRALELAPQAITKHATFALLLLETGRGEEALAEAMRESEELYRTWALAIVHHGLGHATESDAALRELIAKHAEEAAVQVAETCAARGEVDRAFEWLDRAHAQHDPGLSDTRSNPRLRPLHNDPRWGAFLERVGFDG